MLSLSLTMTKAQWRSSEDELERFGDGAGDGDGDELERFGSAYPRSCAKYVMVGHDDLRNWETYTHVEGEGWERAAYETCKAKGGSACAYSRNGGDTISCFPQTGDWNCCVVDAEVEPEEPPAVLPPFNRTDVYRTCGVA